MRAGEKTRPRSPADRTPSLHDPRWMAFTTEKERLSDRVDGNWRALRRGLSRLRAKFVAGVPVDALDREIAFALFDHAIHWELSPRIVRAAFSRVWSDGFAIYERVTAAALFWGWASRLSPVDLGNATSAVSEARELIGEEEDSLRRLNLERMLNALTVARNDATT